MKSVLFLSVKNEQAELTYEKTSKILLRDILQNILQKQ